MPSAQLECSVTELAAIFTFDSEDALPGAFDVTSGAGRVRGKLRDTSGFESQPTTNAIAAAFRPGTDELWSVLRPTGLTLEITNGSQSRTYSLTVRHTLSDPNVTLLFETGATAPIGVFQQTGTTYETFLMPDGRIREGSFSRTDLKLDTLSSVKLPTSDFSVSTIVASPDRSTGVFTTCKDGCALWTVPASGGSPRKIADLPQDLSSPEVYRYGVMTLPGS